MFAGTVNDLTEKLFSDDLMNKLIAGNDKHVAVLVQNRRQENSAFGRHFGNDFAMLASAYVSPKSKYYHSEIIVEKLEILVRILHQYQTADGTVNIGNLESPPDTAFLIELLASGAKILINDGSTSLGNVNRDIKKFMLQSGEALTTGGVHTPNHRWVISAALAKINALYPNKKYVNRINEWLAEGVYMDSDGHYPERSSIYSRVENNAFVTMGSLLNRPALFEPVRKNLSMTWYYVEPNGDLVTNDSRRQDQYKTVSVLPHYLLYRNMAIRDNNKLFAAIATFIENMPGFEEEVINNALFHFLEELLLQKEMPSPAGLQENYQKLFTTTSLLRVRNNKMTATLFGGADQPVEIASGRSNSPDFFAYRKGAAVLKHLRLSTAFFSTGYFYSDGIKKVGDKYRLYKKLDVPYYQPLSKSMQNAKGDYKLSPSIDGRFWNKMDFKNRPVSNVKTLQTSVEFSESNGDVELNISVAGLAGVNVTIELCFIEDGKLSGVSSPENDNYFLEKGFGKYESGGDTITFGLGALATKAVTRLEGERYSSHFGNLRGAGKHVYITGVTPFKHTLKFS